MLWKGPAPAPNKSIAPLRGELSGLHRLRVGDYRVIIELDTAQGYLLVHAIAYLDILR